MDSIEVAVRFTEAIMAKSGAMKRAADPADSYVKIFADVLKEGQYCNEPSTGGADHANLASSPTSHIRSFPFDPRST